MEELALAIGQRPGLGLGLVATYLVSASVLVAAMLLRGDTARSLALVVGSHLALAVFYALGLLLLLTIAGDRGALDWRVYVATPMLPYVATMLSRRGRKAMTGA